MGGGDEHTGAHRPVWVKASEWAGNQDEKDVRLQPLLCACGDSGHGSASVAGGEPHRRLHRGKHPPGPKQGRARQSRQKLPCVPTCVR